jgi:hypothetical protein
MERGRGDEIEGRGTRGVGEWILLVRGVLIAVVYYL